MGGAPPVSRLHVSIIWFPSLKVVALLLALTITSSATENWMIFHFTSPPLLTDSGKVDCITGPLLTGAHE